MAYATEIELAGYVRNERGAVDASFRTSILDAASSAIDGHCGRTFVVAGDASARTFVPSGMSALYIDDATAVSSVSVDGVALASTDWQAEPLGGRVNGSTEPYYRLVRLGGAWTESTYRKATVSVTATWGWAAVPPRVKQACLIVAKQIAEERDARSGLVDFGEFAARVTSSPTVSFLLQRLRRFDRVGGV